MRKSRNIQMLLFLLPVLLMAAGSYGQNCIRGRVVSSENGTAIEGANLFISSSKGTGSDRNGAFEICGLTNDSVTLHVSYLGFETLLTRVKPGASQPLILRMKPAGLSMDELVVTATRTDSRIMNTPVRVHLMTPHMLENTPANTIDEALKLLPGVNWSRPFGIFSTKAIVTLRGLSGKEQGRVMVLLDGVPLNKSDGGTVDWNMIDMDVVKKIEVTKGAGSALYGGNAMGGMINIITGLPDDKFYIKASAEYGTFNTAGARVSAGGKKNLEKAGRQLFWNANTFYRRSDGYITQSPADQAANPYITKSNLMETGVNLHGGYTLGENHKLDAMVNYYNDHRGTGEVVNLKDGNVTDHDSYGVTLHYSGMAAGWKISTAAYILTEYYKKVNEYKKDDYTWYDVLSVRRDLGLNTSLSRSLGRLNLLTAGFDYRNGSVDAYDKYFTSTDIVYNEGKINSFALFLQDEVSLLSNRLRVVAGLRYDLSQFYDGSFRIENPSPETSFMFDYQVPDMPVQNWAALSPRISAQYRITENSRIYVMYSRGFRPSVLDDLCRSGRIKGGFKIANPSVKPEYLNNYELGADFSVLHLLKASASLYYSRGKDFQYYISNGETIDMGFGDRPIFIRANISDVQIMGVETELRADLPQHLQVFCNYAFNHSEILAYHKIAQNDTIDLAGKLFTDVPDHILSAGINWNHPWISLSLAYHYTGAMYINDQNVWDEILLSDRYPAYSTIDIRAWKDLSPKFRLSVDVQNLMDKKYYDSKYAVCPGRYITATFTYKFTGK